ncbi:MAG: hypothetical protein U0R80_02830 [Nocardioidaceae bacterium]
MTPLGGALLGMAVVVVDVRVNGFDLILDPAGWAILAFAVGRLSAVDGWFRAAAAFAWVGVLAAVPVVTTAEATAPRWVADLTLLLQSAVLFSMCTAMIRHLPAGHPGRRWLDPVRWVDLGATLAVYLLTPFGDVGALLAVVGLLAFVVAAVVFVVITWTLRAEPPFASPRRMVPA